MDSATFVWMNIYVLDEKTIHISFNEARADTSINVNNLI